MEDLVIYKHKRKKMRKNGIEFLAAYSLEQEEPLFRPSRQEMVRGLFEL